MVISEVYLYFRLVINVHKNLSGKFSNTMYMKIMLLRCLISVNLLYVMAPRYVKITFTIVEQTYGQKIN